MKLLTVMWSNYIPELARAAARNNIDLTAFSTKQLAARPEARARLLAEMKACDGLLLYRTNDDFWPELDEALKAAQSNGLPVLITGPDPAGWGGGNVGLKAASAAYRYLLYGGRENYEGLIKFTAGLFGHSQAPAPEPVELPWEGIYHPDCRQVFSDVPAYLEAARARLGQIKAWAGLLFSRSNWVNRNLEIENLLIRELEHRGLGVIPVFYYAGYNESIGNLSGLEVVEKFFLPQGQAAISVLIKMGGFMLSSPFSADEAEKKSAAGVDLLKRLGAPVLGPTLAYYHNREQWADDPAGLGSQAAWSVAMPEFEGIIEPTVIGTSPGMDEPENERYEALPERVARLADRALAWARLARKDNAKKKVAFILHSNPCSSLEASVGGGAHLDPLESVARILQAMRGQGYLVEPPASGQALIDDIMERKAISEFRWTTVQEIVAKGGDLSRVSPELYQSWFEELPPQARDRMIEAWGHPPGEEQGGLPSAMLYQGDILITGVRYGNAVVLTQPKRGCAGSRCDGTVCKILHDPDVPPPHQYVAVYKWLSREFGADAIVHVGTHGNLEFLPGKSTGLSAGCFPDVGVDSRPHLYIYNADNPPEGTVAKRRSLAVLISHLQTLMASGELYGDLSELEKMIGDWRKFKDHEPGQAHILAHQIMNKASEIKVLDGEINHDNFEDRLQELHEVLSSYQATMIPKGLHVFGQNPEGDELSDFIYSILSYEAGPDSLRSLLEKGLAQGEQSAESFPAEIEGHMKAVCAQVAGGFKLSEALETLSPGPWPQAEELGPLEEKIRDIRDKIKASDEMGGLLTGLGGGYIEAGPSGLITRGRPDILPTGRNFYSLDPYRVPSKAAWASGRRLAERSLERYLEEEGGYPANIAFYWQCADLMWSDGEGLAQMLHLLGVKPVWEKNGRVRSFELVSLEELGRPRIDLTVRVSGIIRDNFPSAIELLDEAVVAVAGLQEAPEMNFVRKHSLEKLGGQGPENEPDWRAATYRIFASKPGTYQAGTQLAVYASAWETEADLARVFLYWNGYAYGRKTFGAPAHRSFQESLNTVELSFNKTVTDEYDLTGCCGHFGTHGGLINAAQNASGRQIRNYYGDTRKQGQVEIRTLSEELRRVSRAKILNPAWIDGLKRHGYRGASEINKRVNHLYGWQATAKAVDGGIFDDVARTFMMNEENRRFFEKENPWALEDMARRLLEASRRGLWQPAEDVQEALEDLYLEMEGWLEERGGEMPGDYQGGGLNVAPLGEMPDWASEMSGLLK